jgi:hypothetical protein
VDELRASLPPSSSAEVSAIQCNIRKEEEVRQTCRHGLLTQGSLQKWFLAPAVLQGDEGGTLEGRAPDLLSW